MTGRMRLPDPSVVAKIIETVADEEILPRFGALREADIREKNPGDLVTIADERSELRLEAALTGLLTGSVVVGEEGVAKDPAKLSRLNGESPVWIIDPLDGTRGFARGRNRFTVIVALAHQGRTVGGWIYHPLNRVMALAVTGEGAAVNGAPLAIPTDAVAHVRRVRDPKKCGLANRGDTASSASAAVASPDRRRRGRVSRPPDRPDRSGVLFSAEPLGPCGWRVHPWAGGR